MITETGVVQKVITPHDYCDRCVAKAYFLVSLTTGDLYFCGHHYAKIIDNAVGYDKLHKFAYDIIDHRTNIG